MTAEKEVFKTHPALLSRVKDLSLGVLLLPLLVGFYFWGKALFQIYSTSYLVTDKRIVIKTGLLATKQIEIHIAEVRGLTITCSLWQRVIGAGTILIETAVPTGKDIVLCDIPKPQKFVDAVNQVRDAGYPALAA